MCPACIMSVAWIAAGAASTGGLAAVVVSKLAAKKVSKQIDEHGKDEGELWKCEKWFHTKNG